MKNEISPSNSGSVWSNGGGQPPGHVFGGQAPSHGPGHGAGEQPLAKLHRMMRGRYALAFVLAAIGASVGAWFGYRSTTPLYQARGWVNMKPVVTGPDGRQSRLDFFSTYVQRQAATIKGQRVITGAMASEWWTRIGMPMTQVEFVRAIDYETAEGLIGISFTHPEKEVAFAGMQSTLKSFANAYKAEDQKDVGSQQSYWTKERNKHTATITVSQSERARLIDKYKSTDLRTLQDEKVRQMGDVARSMRDLDSQIRRLKFRMDAGSSTRPMDVAEIAAVDPNVRQALQYQEAAAETLRIMRQDLPEGNPQVVAADRAFRVADGRLQNELKRFREAREAEQPGGGFRLEQVELEELTRQVEVEKAEYDRIRREHADIGADAIALAEHTQRIADAKKELAEADDRLNQAENSLRDGGSRLEILDEGMMPEVPYSDRRKQFAFMGAVAGGAAPLALLLLLGLMDKRTRYSDDATTGMAGVNLLGILPEMPERMKSPEQASLAAHCVHQIRTMLQISAMQGERRVIGVTSSSPGDGKTSLTLALGLSFAASGSRTLLIDCDLVGGGLTSRLNVHEPQGVLEAIQSRDLLRYVKSTDVAGLSILPIGRASELTSSILSPASLRRLLADAKKNFDTVLIDTGPVLGSIEASQVASSADAMVLTITRGQPRAVCERSINFLRSVGANLAGVVFNRAMDRDFEQSVSRMSVRALPATNTAVRSTDDEQKFGPVARAVASSVKSPNAASEE